MATSRNDATAGDYAGAVIDVVTLGKGGGAVIAGKKLGPKILSKTKGLLKAPKGKVSKAADSIEDYLGSGAKSKINEAGDLVVESAKGTKKVRFDIKDPSPHKSPHGHVEEFSQVKNKMKPKFKSGPIYPKDVPHE